MSLSFASAQCWESLVRSILGRRVFSDGEVEQALADNVGYSRMPSSIKRWGVFEILCECCFVGHETVQMTDLFGGRGSFIRYTTEHTCPRLGRKQLDDDAVVLFKEGGDP